MLKMSGIYNSNKSAGSYFVGKHDKPEAGNEPSIFRTWLQNRLREYNLKTQLLSRQINEEVDLDLTEFTLHFDNVDACFDELRVLEVQNVPTSLKENDDCEDCVIKGIPVACEDALYETSEKRFVIRIQRNGSPSRVETLHLSLQVGEVSNLNLLNQIVHPFVPSSEKHSIDMFTTLFPMIQGWMEMRKQDVELAVQICYYGKCEDHTEIDMESLLNQTKDDIMSKVAAGMEMDKKKNEAVVESHRILILQDIRQEGYVQKNYTGSSFLPLLNVKAALVEVAKIHAVSWAFSKNTGKTLNQHWPFLECKQAVSHLLELLKTSFPVLLTMSKLYLEKNKSPDKDKVLKALQSINGGILEKVNPNNFHKNGPVTLLHQGLNFSTVLFRHSFLKDTNPQEFTPGVSSPKESHGGDKVSRNSSGGLLIKRDVCILDWKCATFGSPLFDVASLLLTSLPPKTRKTETPSLLKLYWEGFEKTASKFGFKGADMSWKSEDLAEDYGKGMLYALLLIASNIKSKSLLGEDDMEIMIEAVRELITLKVI